MFIRHQEPQSDWVETLEGAFGGPNPRLPWLTLVWLAGEDYEPVQRWGIYEMHPRLDAINPRLLDEFSRPHPRERGFWRQDCPDCRQGLQKLNGDLTPKCPVCRSETGVTTWHSESLVSSRQYDLFHRYSAWPQLTWIIQGDDGGHAWTISSEEERLLRLRYRLPKDHPLLWPPPGGLCYAPFDNRVLAHLRKRDKLVKWEQAVGDWERRYMTDGKVDVTRASAVMRQEKDEQEAELRVEISRWLTDEFARVQDMLTRDLALKILEDAPVGGGVSDEQIAHQEEEMLR